MQSISLGSKDTPGVPDSSGSTTSSGPSVVLGGATVDVVVVVVLVVVVFFGFLGFFVVDFLVVLDNAGTGADVGLIDDDDGFGFGFGLRVVVGSTTSLSSGLGGVAGGFAHSGCKYTHTHNTQTQSECSLVFNERRSAPHLATSPLTRGVVSRVGSGTR